VKEIIDREQKERRNLSADRTELQSVKWIVARMKWKFRVVGEPETNLPSKKYFIFPGLNGNFKADLDGDFLRHDRREWEKFFGLF
jgi:hypothetical protein